MNYHLRVELGYANDLPYEVLSERVHPVYKDFEGGPYSQLNEARRVYIVPHERYASE
jgi:hypothetical protein